MRVLRRIAGLLAVCYARCVPPSTLRSTLQESRGLSVMEVLAVTMIVSIAVIGVALMFGKGSAWVSATGADRVAAALAQQRIEQIRACGWEVATAYPPLGQPPVQPNAPPPNASESNCPTSPKPDGEPPWTGLGRLDADPEIRAGNDHKFIRTVCIQYVDPSTPNGIAEPAFDPASCLPGNPTPMVRITVGVSSEQPETSPVTLQAWMHCLESRPSSWVSAPCPNQVSQ
jgi:hypothetical protein